jgi:hypothetical protein
MAWLGEEIAAAAAGALAPRCTKDLIEERLFERRRDLFSDLSLPAARALGLTAIRRITGQTARAEDAARQHRRREGAGADRDDAFIVPPFLKSL